MCAARPNTSNPQLQSSNPEPATMPNALVRLNTKLANTPYLAPILLTIVCLLLYYSALSGGWRYDDGPHLYFTAKYSPWEYFFIPEIMREQSWANLTPWNAFFYEIGLPFFGLNATGHYAHLLIIIWATAVATYFLLRLWLSPLKALIGPLVFLSMPPTGAIAQMLMTGHYAYGLLFTIIALYFYVASLRNNRWWFALVGAIFYLLACWCKELYVPLVGVLLFLPEANWKKRIKFITPLHCGLIFLHSLPDIRI